MTEWGGVLSKCVNDNDGVNDNNVQ
jgi:hypothetical protein